MFESSLLRARASKTTITPILTELDDDSIALCKRLILIYLESAGKKRKEIDKRTKDVERSYDYRLVRGLTELLDRASIYEVEPCQVEPTKAREAVFHASTGLTASQEERSKVLKDVAESLSVSAADLERIMYADLDEELILKETKIPTEKDLLKEYNVELVETLLMRAAKLRFSLSEGWQPVFRRIKQYGLMYEISGLGRNIVVEVQGPAQLLKLMDRYGSEMAKLLPEILKAKEWNISAEILSRDKKRFMTFEMKTNDLLAVMIPDDRFDSTVERRFATSFTVLDSKWTVKREAEVIAAGSYAFIPDFLFELGDRKVYFEIVGFWTKEYLERKISKLKSLPEEIDLIVAANEDLACTKLAEASKNLFYYSGSKVPLKPVAEYLSSIEKEVVEEQSKMLSISPSGNIFDIEEFSRKNGLILSAVFKSLENKDFPGYVRVGDYFIKAEKLEQIKKKIETVRRYATVSNILAEDGITKPDQILTALHYTVVWESLLNAEIVPGE